MDPLKVIIFLFTLLTIVNHIESNSLPMNKLVRDAVRRKQREALAESANSDEESEDAAETTSTSPDDSSSSSASSSESESTTASPPRSKNATKIDWNEIEKTWYEWKEDAEIKKKWDDMEKGMKKGKQLTTINMEQLTNIFSIILGVKSVLRSIFPRIVAMSSDTKVSGNCSAGILKWLISLRSLKDWSIRSEYYNCDCMMIMIIIIVIVSG